MAAFLIQSGLMNGVFGALDGVLFYVFFEAMLIPLYLIIGMWGGPNRVYAAIKFFLYTLLGSLLMLVALIYLFFQSGGSFEILDLAQAALWHDRPDPAVRGLPSPSRSRCRCGRCTPGCRTPTSRPPPAVRWCWRPSP
jgi:NADH-quinone oxidoreductase subunit M